MGTEIWRRMPEDDGEGDWNAVAGGQGNPRIAGQPTRSQKEARNGYSP